MAKKTFISFYNKDLRYKEQLINLNEKHNIFIDGSVDTGDISDQLSDESIRVKIRDEYLRDSSVTIVLFGSETAKRKHVDWEIGSSMIDSPKNRRSGIIVVLLESINSHSQNNLIPTPELRKMVSPKLEEESWGKNWRTEMDLDFLGERLSTNITKTFLEDKSKLNETIIPIISLADILNNPQILSLAIEYVSKIRNSITYDISIPFRKNNS